MENESNLQLKDKNKKIKLWFAIGFSAVITISLISYAVYFWQKTKTDELEMKYQQQLSSLQAQKNKQQIMNDIQINQPTKQEDMADTFWNVVTDNQINNTINLDKITVNWEKKITKLEDDCPDSQCFLVGTITNDDPAYKGKNLYLKVTATMGGSDMQHYIIENAQKVYAEGSQGADNGIKIVGINDLPDEITFPGTNYRLKKHYAPTYLFSDIKTGKKLFTDAKIGDFFLTKDGCIVAELPDHTAIAYDFILPFIGDENKVADITFDDGKKNKDEYEYITHSCGGICTNLTEIKPDDLKVDDRLEIIGKTISGESVYRIKDSKDKVLKNLYNDKNTLAYYGGDYQQQGKSKYSYDEFIKLNPYLFWQDPMGRWIQFTNSKFNSAAEMCKPVIYLYPQTEINLNLKVNLNGSLTHTDPPYNDGWKITAMPDGKIKNLENNQSYDYLLWEGVGVNYPNQDKGWVVKKDDLGSFLDEKLGKLGLNEKEASDFKEYWLARLNENPFYKISFLTRNQFDSLASIEFNPTKPNVFIRVMMTAKGMDEFSDIQEQIMPANAPIRNGFTAVEWGGALLK